MTYLLEKLWKKIYHMAIALAKQTPPYHLIKEHHRVFDTLEKFKIETHKTIEIIRKNLHRSRPTLPNRCALEEYIKRIDFANEIILGLDNLLIKTFDTYFEFINLYWDIHENLENNEQQKILAEKYNMSASDWQSLTNKIDRFNEMTKNFL